MFKSAAIWRIDRNSNRTKSVFKLHFRVTQVPVLVGDALLVSVIPKDVGKPTNRLERGVVEDGVCSWKSPVYETVRFVRDPKTGKFVQKIYYFIVSTGNQKSNVVGEVLIDFAEYAESSKPSSVSLPFKNPLCTAVLHITIQRMQEQAELRSFMEGEDVKVRLEARSPKISLGDEEIDEKEMSTDQGTPLVKTISENVASNGNRRVSSGPEVLSSSDRASEISTSCEITHTPMIKRMIMPNQELQQQKSECSVSFDGFSTDDSTINSQDSIQNERTLAAADVEIEKLKSKLVILARQAEFSSLELQTLRKQIVKESKRGNDLAKELIDLKEERDELKAAQKHIDVEKAKNRGVRDPLVLIEELRQELQNERNLNANLKLQLQKTQESNTELILAVQDLDEMLEQKNNDIPNPHHKATSCELPACTPELSSKCSIQEDEEQNALEELVNSHGDVEDASIVEQRKVIELYHNMEVCRRAKDDIEMQMEQLALDYEILKQENQEMAYRLEQSQLQEQLKVQYECSYSSVNEIESQIERLEKELRNQENQYADSLTKISELQNEVGYLEDELEKQAHGFEADIESVMSAKVEQEKRAILAEEALRVTKKINADTAERLLEYFKRVFKQLGSAFDENEKLSMKAMNEAAELRQENNRLEILLHKATDELTSVKNDYEAKLDELSNQVQSSMHHIDEMKSEADYKINQLEAQILREKEMYWGLSQEMLVLKDEIQRLTEFNNVILKEKELLKAELEQAITSTDEAEMLLIGRNVELSELEDTLALISEKADETMEDLVSTRSMLKEKGNILANVALELEELKAQCNTLEQTSSEDELEKENLREQVLQLKRDIETKEDALSTAEEKLREINGYIAITNGTKKEAARLIEKIGVLEGQIRLSEESLETTVNSFMEKEKDLQDKIKELESRADELNQNCICSFDCQVQKDGIDAADNCKVDQVDCINYQEISKITFNSNRNGLEMAAPQSDQSNLNTVMSEMGKLKERNTYMEMELKELQGRYSEISLKFAEVEGERQKLVMSLRYHKSSRRR